MLVMKTSIRIFCVAFAICTFNNVSASRLLHASQGYALSQGTNDASDMQQLAYSSFQGEAGKATAMINGDSAMSSAWSYAGDASKRSTQLSEAGVRQSYKRRGSWFSTFQSAGNQQPSVQSPTTDNANDAQKTLTNEDMGSTPQQSGSKASDNNSGLMSIMDLHNEHRARHRVASLAWSSRLESGAQEWADNCVFSHSQSGDGENLAKGYSSVDDAVRAWYNEETSYNYNSPSFSKSTGHFTQMVWKGTTELGCGYNAGCKMLVCRYAPAGNVQGQFGKNVLPPV